jgi:hypothetical protein
VTRIAKDFGTSSQFTPPLSVTVLFGDIHGRFTFTAIASLLYIDDFASHALQIHILVVANGKGHFAGSPY